MMKVMKNAFISFVTVGLLAACSSETGDEPESVPRLIFGVATEVFSNQREGRPEQTVVTPKMLAETKVAAIQVNPERRGGSDFLRRLAKRDDSQPGTVEVWASSDNAQIFLRNGIVVGTRGVGGDMISSDAALTVDALMQREAKQGQRRFVISDGDTTTTDYRFACDISNEGAEIISVVEQSFPTTHLRESCSDMNTGLPVFTNDYWVIDGTTDLKRSRQWMGPATGYFEIVLLKK